MKKIKILKIISITFLCIMTISIVFFSMIFERQNIGKITSMNHEAKLNYKYFVSDLINLEEYVLLSENLECYVFGEQYNNDYYLAYANTILDKDTLLYGKNYRQPNIYWAIKISKGVIVSSWVSHSPLNKEQLLPYSFDDQKKQVAIFEKNRGSKIVGYYNAEVSNTDK